MFTCIFVTLSGFLYMYFMILYTFYFILFNTKNMFKWVKNQKIANIVTDIGDSISRNRAIYNKYCNIGNIANYRKYCLILQPLHFAVLICLLAIPVRGRTGFAEPPNRLWVLTSSEDGPEYSREGNAMPLVIRSGPEKNQ